MDEVAHHVLDWVSRLHARSRVSSSSRKHALQAGSVANGWTQAGDALGAVGTVPATRMTSGAKHLVDEELLCEWLHHRCYFRTRISLQAVADLLRGRHAAMTSDLSPRAETVHDSRHENDDQHGRGESLLRRESGTRQRVQNDIDSLGAATVSATRYREQGRLCR